jgi:copper(I)-binding protein
MEWRLPVRTKAAALTGALALAIGLGGCGAGQHAQTAEQGLLSGGARGAAGSVVVRNARIVFTGPIPGDTVYRPGDDVPLQLSIVNEGDQPDRLVAVTSPIAADGFIVGDTVIPGGHTLVAGYDEPAADVTLPDQTEIDVTLTDVSTPIRSGLTYPVELDFARAGAVSLTLPVEVPADVLPPRANQPEPTEGTDDILETGPQVTVAPR